MKPVIHTMLKGIYVELEYAMYACGLKGSIISCGTKHAVVDLLPNCTEILQRYNNTIRTPEHDIVFSFDNKKMLWKVRFNKR